MKSRKIYFRCFSHPTIFLRELFSLCVVNTKKENQWKEGKRKFFPSRNETFRFRDFHSSQDEKIIIFLENQSIDSRGFETTACTALITSSPCIFITNAIETCIKPRKAKVSNFLVASEHSFLDTVVRVFLLELLPHYELFSLGTNNKLETKLIIQVLKFSSPKLFFSSG